MVELVATGKSDREIAANLKDRASKALLAVTAIMDEARRADLVLNFQIGVDGFGRNVVTALTIVKPL